MQYILKLGLVTKTSEMMTIVIVWLMERFHELFGEPPCILLYILVLHCPRYTLTI